MPRNVTNDHPLADPVAAWKGGATPGEISVDMGLGAAIETVKMPEPPAAMIPLPEPGPGMLPDVPDHGLKSAALPKLVTCPSGHPVSEAAKFCAECGSPVVVAGPWTCGQGHTSTETAKFCAECGDPRPDMRPPIAGAGVMAEMAARVNSSVVESFRPRPESELTEEEKAERQRLHAEAIRLGAAMPPVQFEPPQPDQDTELIHITGEGEGFTAFGQVWHRGQELELVIGSDRWNEAQRWINMTDAQQMERYGGKVMFRHGPWPGARSYAAGLQDGQPVRMMSLDGKTEVGGPTLEQLHQADQAEQQRGRRVPARRI
jgi:hypothetical protein